MNRKLPSTFNTLWVAGMASGLGKKQESLIVILVVATLLKLGLPKSQKSGYHHCHLHHMLLLPLLNTSRSGMAGNPYRVCDETKRRADGKSHKCEG